MDFSKLSDAKIELKTKSQTDNLPLSQSEESHTFLRANTLRSNTDSPNIDSSNKDRENHLQMDSDEDTDSEEPATAGHDEGLKIEVDRIYGASVKILGLQNIIRSALEEVGDMNVKGTELEFMSRSREARGSPSSPQDREEKAVRLTHEILKVVADAIDGDPDTSPVPEPLQSKSLPKFVLSSKIALNVSELNSVLLSQRLKTDGVVNAVFTNFILRRRRKEGGRKQKQPKTTCETVL